MLYVPDATASRTPERIELSKRSKFVVAKLGGRGMLSEEDAVTEMVMLVQPAGITWLFSMGEEKMAPARRSTRAKKLMMCVIVEASGFWSLFVVSSGLVREIFCGIWNSGYQFREEATLGEWKLISLRKRIHSISDRVQLDKARSEYSVKLQRMRSSPGAMVTETQSGATF
jgi:hypothetical protein